MTEPRWVLGIWCSAVAALVGCEADSEVGTCLLLFENTWALDWVREKYPDLELMETA